MPDTTENIGRIGQIAAELMERLESEELPDGEQGTVGVVAIVAEVTVEEEDGPGRTHVTYRCSDPRSWIQQGLFTQAVRAAQEGRF